MLFTFTMKGKRIQTHNLSNISRLPKPLDQSSCPTLGDFADSQIFRIHKSTCSVNLYRGLPTKQSATVPPKTALTSRAKQVKQIRSIEKYSCKKKSKI